MNSQWPSRDRSQGSVGVTWKMVSYCIWKERYLEAACLNFKRSLSAGGGCMFFIP